MERAGSQQGPVKAKKHSSRPQHLSRRAVPASTTEFPREVDHQRPPSSHPPVLGGQAERLQTNTTVGVRSTEPQGPVHFEFSLVILPVLSS
ncbi:Hypp4758 [Branchiostoma lanceolatum]|uniref:Hypp4758 protein n=1 Tax=Branchiostoma lanceolatum TaxID=7740 RepID=A0A8K0A9Y2_BRALA|nr:Hypp4758 [Branchiostoma lanceolatum]